VLIVFLGIVQYLQDLHDTLKSYTPPSVVHPSIESLKPRRSLSFASWFRPPPMKASIQGKIDTPKGLYMYGDVGSGKTMLMDLFFDTLPPHIERKTRVHFHNFMQDVHRRLHTMKSKHGSDLDAILYVAADIAEDASVLCFDEFQCTDVADAMILRR
jgi:protein AFG1